MMKQVALRALVALGISATPAASQAQPIRSGNPILPGWYADPEAHVFDRQYWIFPTYSAPYNAQTFMDAFSSRDLVTWTKHARVLDTANVRWAKRAVWAPSVIEKQGWYYLFFGANDIQNDNEVGGIGVARAKSPSGPFMDFLGKPLIDKFYNGAQPIDQMVFRDTDGAYYIIFGGWRHCNIARLNDAFTGFIPFPDGSTFKEITPQGYVEGAYMFMNNGKYYFMWSEGGWTGPNYAVAYAIGSSPFGPFERVGKILAQDSTVATGAGHHSVLHAPNSSRFYIVYHRRPLGETDRNHRVVSIDELRFDERGFIAPVVITTTGVQAEMLSRKPWPRNKRLRCRAQCRFPRVNVHAALARCRQCATDAQQALVDSACRERGVSRPSDCDEYQAMRCCLTLWVRVIHAGVVDARRVTRRARSTATSRRVFDCTTGVIFGPNPTVKAGTGRVAQFHHHCVRHQRRPVGQHFDDDRRVGERRVASNLAVGIELRGSTGVVAHEGVRFRMRS